MSGTDATKTVEEGLEVATHGGSSLDITIGNVILRKDAMANAKLLQTMDVDLKVFMAKGASLPSGGSSLPRGRGLPRGGATLPISGGGVLYHTSFHRKLMTFENNFGKFGTPVKEGPKQAIVRNAPGARANATAPLGTLEALEAIFLNLPANS